MAGIIVITLTSLIMGILLSVAYQYINKSNQDVKNISLMLPGYNCNACGFGTCQMLAEVSLKDADIIVKCRFLKEDKIKEIKEYIKSIK